MKNSKIKEKVAKKVAATFLSISLSFAFFFTSYSEIFAYTGETPEQESQQNSELQNENNTISKTDELAANSENNNSTADDSVDKTLSTNAVESETNSTSQQATQDSEENQALMAQEEDEEVLFAENGAGTQEDPYRIDVTDTTLANGFTVTTTDAGNSVFSLTQTGAFYTITGGTENTPTANSILVNADNITINTGNLYIQTDDIQQAPLNTNNYTFTINTQADTISSFVNIYTNAPSSLTTSSLSAGIQHSQAQSESNGTLTITGDGTLIAKGSKWGAGIGSSNGNPSGIITIMDNATVEAVGGEKGAGIGGGGSGGSNIPGANTAITICGNSVVTATGGSGGAGIGGGGYKASGGDITINGQSTVTATGGDGGAGIGGGRYGAPDSITISGTTTVVATGTGMGAGIGGGSEGAYGEIMIGGNTHITATGGPSSLTTYSGGSGIGTGGLYTGLKKTNQANSHLTITGGTIIATGAYKAPGIGATTGFNTSYTNAGLLTGGNVYATGGYAEGLMPMINATGVPLYQNLFALQGSTTEELVYDFSSLTSSAYTLSDVKAIVLDDNGKSQSYISVWLPASEALDEINISTAQNKLRGIYVHNDTTLGNTSHNMLYLPTTVTISDTVGGSAQILSIVDPFGNEYAQNPPVIYPQDSVTISATAQPNYTFSGWQTQSVALDDAQQKQESITFELPGTAVKIAPIFTAQEYNIFYELDGGINSPQNPSFYEYAEGVPTFFPAEKDGYSFIGWYTDADFTKEITDISNTQEDDITLYAKYEKRFTVSVKNESNGSALITKAGNNIEQTDTLSQLEVGTLVEVVATADTGYTFKEWKTENLPLTSEQRENVTLTFVMPDADITITPSFENETYTITYELNNGVNSNNNPTNYTFGTSVILAQASREGATFEGWYTDANFTQNITEITDTQVGNITLYAKFTEDNTNSNPTDSSTNNTNKEYTVSYVTYDLTPISTVNLATGENVPLVNAPTVSGHTFSGWMLEGTDSYWAENTPMPSENITLVATYNKDTTTSNNTSTAPKTGDSSNLTLWGTLTGVTTLAMVGILVFYKKRKKDTSNK